MLIEVCRALLPIMACAHVILSLWVYVPEITACADMHLPTVSRLNDLIEAQDRASKGVYFYAALCIDIVCMVYITLVSSPSAGRHDIRGYSRWVPAIMLVSTISFRARYMYCTPHDPECCESLQCPTTAFAMSMPGCTANTFPVDWHDRQSWCAMPSWYTSHAAKVCGGLASTPDVASCYRYGCSPLVPVQYNGTRVIMWSSILFALLSLVPYRTQVVYKKK